jgi:hypothetical protein
MSQTHKYFGLFALGAACVVLAALVGLANANDEASVLVDKKAEPAKSAPVLAAPANEETLPPPSIPVVEAPKPTEPTAKQPFMRPATPKRRVPVTTALSVKQEPMPAPEAVEVSEVEVRPTPPIVYDTDRDARRMYRSSGEVELVMVTQNPADGCFYEIPLCIPACCVGEPTVNSGRGLLGRGVVEYCWPSCGFRAIVKFRQIVHCDVKVEYEGD